MNNLINHPPVVVFQNDGKDMNYALTCAEVQLGKIQEESKNLDLHYRFENAGWCQLDFEVTDYDQLENSAENLPSRQPSKFKIILLENKSLTEFGVNAIANARPDTLFRMQPDPSNPTGGDTAFQIAPNSGIVGRILTETTGIQGMNTYYEGNLYDAVNLRTLSEREHCAADRLVTKYPTVARTFIPKKELFELFEISVYQR